MRRFDAACTSPNQPKKQSAVPRDKEILATALKQARLLSSSTHTLMLGDSESGTRRHPYVNHLIKHLREVFLVEEMVLEH
jgi:hypothetical protein